MKTCLILLFGVKVAHSQLVILYQYLHIILGDFSWKRGILQRAGGASRNFLETFCSTKREEVQKEEEELVQSRDTRQRSLRREEENKTTR